MTRCVYTGHETLTFTDYTDQETGRTLTAEPGRVYEVAPASGRLVPDIPTGWFTPAEGEPEQPAAENPEGEAVNEPPAETGEQQQDEPQQQE